MKDDPYSGLAGLDSRLFTEEHTKTRKHANKETRLSAGQPQSQQGSKDAGREGAQRGSKDGRMAPDQQASQLASGQAMKVASGRANSAKPRAGKGRIQERHTFEIYQDQVRWMSRLKLDVQELYDERVTINGIVRLGLDVLREEYERNGDASVLIRALVRGQQVQLKAGSVASQGKTDGGS